MCLNFVFFRASLYKSTAARKKRKTQMPRNHQVSGHFIKKIKICLQMINKKLFSDITKHNVSFRRGSGALSTVWNVRGVKSRTFFLIYNSLPSYIILISEVSPPRLYEESFPSFHSMSTLIFPFAVSPLMLPSFHAEGSAGSRTIFPS